MDIEILLQQKALNRMGIPCGVEDGIAGPLFRKARAAYDKRVPVILQQQAMLSEGLAVGKVDGLKGPIYENAIDQFKNTIKFVEDVRKPEDIPFKGISSFFPNPDYRSMVNFYGQPGNVKMVKMKLPYAMRLYTRGAPLNVDHVWIHEKCEDSLFRILHEILDTFGMDYIVEQGLDIYAGIYNNRNSRNSSKKSTHAWACAIDINPAENMNEQRWSADKVGQPGWATMPLEVIRIFEKHGWKSGARAWGRDAMHFQATK